MNMRQCILIISLMVFVASFSPVHASSQSGAETDKPGAVEAIDKDQQFVTLKSAEEESKTVKARNPNNLEKVKVGDKVMISYTAVLGISVTK